MQKFKFNLCRPLCASPAGHSCSMCAEQAHFPATWAVSPAQSLSKTLRAVLQPGGSYNEGKWESSSLDCSPSISKPSGSWKAVWRNLWVLYIYMGNQVTSLAIYTAHKQVRPVRRRLLNQDAFADSKNWEVEFAFFFLLFPVGISRNILSCQWDPIASSETTEVNGS